MRETSNKKAKYIKKKKKAHWQKARTEQKGARERREREEREPMS